MFEFIKGLNNKLDYKYLKIDNKTKKKYVYHIDKELKKEIDAFLKESFPDCPDISFSVIIENFFDMDREIYFKKKKSSGGFEIYYSFNDEEFDNNRILRLFYSINFINKVIKNSCVVEISLKNSSLDYDLSYRNGKFEKILKYDKKTEYIDGKVYCRRIYGDNYNVTVSEINREIILTCFGNINGIKNEDELKEYLLNIENIDSIKDIYNRIYNLSLKEDKNINKVDLIITENGDEISKIHIDKCGLGLINIKYQYEIIENGKRIYYLYEKPSHTMISNSIYDGVINIVNGDYIIAIFFPYFSGCRRDDLLKDYLLNLEFPVKIEDIFKEVFREFGNDSCFRIEIMYKKQTTDLIKIYKGNLLEFKSIRDNLIVSSGIENDNMGNSIYDGINEAKDYKVRIKKLIDNLISRDNS